MKKLFSLFIVLAMALSATAARPYLVGHRGSYWAVENTAEAFELGCTRGQFDYLECDIKVTKDKKFIVTHDDDTERLGASTKTIASTNLADLKKIKLTQTRGSKTYTGYLCDLDEYLDICAKYGKRPVIELKWATGVNSNDQSNMPALVKAIEAKGFRKTCIILTSMKPCLEYLHKNYPDIKLQFLTSEYWESHFDWCVSNKIDVDIQTGSWLTKTTVNKYHNAGLKVNIWTVNSTSNYNTYKNMGVDFITTDYLEPSDFGLTKWEDKAYPDGGTSEPATPSLTASKTSFTLSGEMGSSTKPYVDITIKGENLTSDIIHNPSNSSVIVTELSGWDARTGGKLRMTLNTEYSKGAGTYEGYVAVQSTSSYRVEINFTTTLTDPAGTDPGTDPIPDTDINVTGLTEKWIYSTNKGNLADASWFSSTTDAPTRDICYANGKIYVLNVKLFGTPTITILDAYTGKKTGTLSCGSAAIAGIKSLGNTVIGCNYPGDTGTLIVYKWASDSAEPEEWFTDAGHGSMQVGRSINTSGNMTDGYISFGSTTGTVTYKVTNSTVNTTPTVITAELAGNASNQSVYALSDGSVWVNNKDKNPLHIKADGTTLATINPDAKYKVYGAAIKAFTYGKRDYIAYTTTLGSTASAAWGNGAMILANVTTESSPVVIGSTCYPAAGLGETAWGGVATNAVDYEITSDNTLNLWVMVPNQGIAMYQFVPSTTTVPDPTPVLTASPTSASMSAIVGETATKKISVSGTDLKGDITLTLSGTNAAMFKLSASSIAKATAKGDITVTYAPTAAGSHSATLTIKSTDATNVTVALTGTATEKDPVVDPNPEINVTALTEKWIYSTNKGNLADAAYFSSAAPNTRDICFANGKLYVLNTNTSEPTVNIIDAYTGKATGKTLSTTGISGGTYSLSSIKSLGNTVIGANFCGATGELKVYKWASDTAEPELWFSTTDHGNMEVGRSFNTSGDMTDGYIAVGSTTGVAYYKVSNGNVNATPTVVTTELAGNASNQSVYVLSDGSFWLNNKDKHPTRIKADGTTQTTVSVDAKYKVYGAAIKAFTYGKRDYIAYTTTLGSTASAAWGNGAMILANVTTESSPVVIGSTCYPAAGLGETAWGTVGTNAVDYEITADNNLNLWVMVPCQGIAMYQFEYIPSGVEDLFETPAEEMPVEWYNLQGVRVDGESLVPGIYIRRQGNNVTKVLVK